MNMSEKKQKKTNSKALYGAKSSNIEFTDQTNLTIFDKKRGVV